MVSISSRRQRAVRNEFCSALRGSNSSTNVVGRKAPIAVALFFVACCSFVVYHLFFGAAGAHPVGTLFLQTHDEELDGQERALLSLSGYEQWQRFRPVPRPETLTERYITLWLHQVHQWFGPDGDERYNNIRTFLKQAKEQARFTSVMTDLSWEWTERDEQGKIDINSFNKDWMKLACEMDLKLQVVIAMRELPPWIQREAHPEYFESSSPACQPYDAIQTPSVANDHLWNHLLRNYTLSATKALLAQYGSCIHSISPTFNNEFETRYSQTYDAMRDYSAAAAVRYKEWQVRKGYAGSLDEAQAPYPVSCGSICEPLRGEAVWRWLGFREEFLADRYITLCQAVKEESATVPVKCFLHIGEMLATTDLLNSNLFFHLAKSSAVDELVMDSNMMLNGAPTSPSVVGLMVSTAKLYGKTVHYEVATERVLPCSSDGKLVENKKKQKQRNLPWRLTGTTATQQEQYGGAPLLLLAGVQHALEAGIDSLGVTNLCQPALVSTVLPFEKPTDKTVSDGRSAATDSSSTMMKRSSKFQPTAMIFVPYRAFFAFSFLTTGVRCGQSAVACWHESFGELPFFGFAGFARKTGGVPEGTCPTDAMQLAVLKQWDDLRLRHEHVVVVGDAAALEHHPELAAATVTERVFVRFPCIMDESQWHFYDGEDDRKLFEAFRAKHPFVEHVARDVC